MSETTPDEHYQRLLGYVREGDFCFQIIARKVAQEHALPLQDLEEALRDGAPKNYERLLKWVTYGDSHFIPVARELADKYGLPIQSLDVAVERCEERRVIHELFSRLPKWTACGMMD